MSRLTGLACAAALLAVTGCKTESLEPSASRNLGKNEQILGGTPQAVATMAQQALEKMSIHAMLTGNNDLTRLAGSTRNNVPFVLLFERRKTDVGESTAIRLQWPNSGAEDSSFWVDFMSNMDAVRNANRTARN